MGLTLRTYLTRLRQMGASDAYLEAVKRNGLPLAKAGLPVILTLGQLAHASGVSYPYILRVVKRTTNPYRLFTIRKRNGGKRFICVSEPMLLQIQRWIHKKILCSEFAVKMLSHNATAYRPGSSHIRNAAQHTDVDWLIKLDIVNFFESISERQVYRFFRHLGYRALVAFCLTRICTRVRYSAAPLTKRWMAGKRREFLNVDVVGHLPQGAPTSPMLANFVCVSLDSALEAVAQQHCLSYTRYADDMTFSGNLTDRTSAAQIARNIKKIISKHGFSINSQKTRIVGNGARKIVTGLSVEQGEIRLPRSYKDQLRMELYFLGRFGLTEHCARTKRKNRLSYLLHLAGKIEYAEIVEPLVGQRLGAKFATLFPKFSQTKQLIGHRRK